MSWEDAPRSAGGPVTSVAVPAALRFHCFDYQCPLCDRWARRPRLADVGEAPPLPLMPPSPPPNTSEWILK